MSARFDPPTLGLGGESVAARLQESSPGGYLRESLLWGLRPRGPWVYVQKKVYCNVLILSIRIYRNGINEYKC
jgi:hypothetical protein